MSRSQRVVMADPGQEPFENLARRGWHRLGEPAGDGRGCDSHSTGQGDRPGAGDSCEVGGQVPADPIKSSICRHGTYRTSPVCCLTNLPVVLPKCGDETTQDLQGRG